MNIFLLDYNPVRAAQAHCDKHVVKMILETAQMLSTAHVELDGEQVAYKPTHKNHPCAIWVRESLGNYQWTVRLLQALGVEYTHRYGRVHKTLREHFATLSKHPQNIPYADMTPFRLAMPDEYRGPNPVTSYRRYYQGEKARISRYTRRQPPHWLNLEEHS